MAAVRLDHPVLMSAEQIRRREFVTTRRGYDPDQVRLYLEELADQVDTMSAMLRETRLEAESAFHAGSRPSADPYDRLAERVASVIREADQTAERLRTEGSREAERILLEARTDADRIRTDAQAIAEEARTEAERALHDPRDQADRTISGLATRREALVEQLGQMQERLLGVARDLEAAIETPDPAPFEDAIETVETVETDETVEAETPLTDTPWASPPDQIVDVRTSDDRAEGDPDEDPARSPHAQRIIADEILDGIVDPSYAELWDGTETIQLEVPDIPPLDLSWGDDDD
ncbi:MAG: DivIVA domain-containing protein [Actinomycetota bacterium]